MKGGLSVGRRLEILRNVRRRLGNKTVSVGLKWSVKCRAIKSECRCRATLILGWMSVSDGKNGSVSGVENTPFMGPNILVYEHEKIPHFMIFWWKFPTHWYYCIISKVRPRSYFRNKALVWGLTLEQPNDRVLQTLWKKIMSWNIYMLIRLQSSPE